MTTKFESRLVSASRTLEKLTAERRQLRTHNRQLSYVIDDLKYSRRQAWNEAARQHDLKRIYLAVGSFLGFLIGLFVGAL